ncbi:MAG: hypothetical protein Salg2KO_14790 [Salibacteraceae bacterium]
MFTSFKYNLLILVWVGLPLITSAQIGDSLISRVPQDTSRSQLNMDAVYSRPFLAVGKTPVALGGYLEVNSLYSGEDGINEGLSFQARRLTMFMAASISKRIRFLTELEFEEGGREINIEFAAMDVAFHPALNFRGGIIMNPIGAFNQNHDGPKWEFIERPDVAVNLLTATWSNPGFGFYGKVHKSNWVLGYEAYFSNGFDNSIINNELSKTYLPASKNNIERFEESNNGQPLITAKTALKNRKIGEIGLSYMGGVYNTFELDGLELEQRSRLDVIALDFNTTIRKSGTYIVGEAAVVMVEVPETYSQQFGTNQRGFFVDVVQPLLRRKVLDWENASLNVAFRVDHTDWNTDSFNETGEEIGDELWAITPAISFRPSQRTVFRLNYRYQWQWDLLNNPPAHYAAWMFGVSTYF